MDYLQTLLDLDSAALARLESPPLARSLVPASDPPPLTAVDTAMLHAARAEIEGVATQLAVSACSDPLLATGHAAPAQGQPAVAA